MTALKVDNQIFEPSSFQITCSLIEIVFFKLRKFSKFLWRAKKNRSDNDGQVFQDYLDVDDGVLETVYLIFYIEKLY